LSVVADFLDAATSLETREGERAAIHKTSALHFPDSLGLGRTELLRGDAHVLWARWFVECVSLADPSESGYAYYLESARGVLKTVLANPSGADRVIAERALARAAWDLAKRRRARRKPVSQEVKDLILLDAGHPPRCWICGSVFTDGALEAFRTGSTEVPEVTRSYVDYLMPRGLNRRDFTIEVDHVVPLARGGADDPTNLRLACGWCNGTKRDRDTLYDSNTQIKKMIVHPRKGRTPVPPSYWVVRVLVASEGQCEAGRCMASARDHAMKVATRFAGAPTPPNLRVVCAEHDETADDRLVPASAFRR
jgi:HNH endonuclease